MRQLQKAAQLIRRHIRGHMYPTYLVYRLHIPCTYVLFCTYIFLWPFEHFSFAFIAVSIPLSLSLLLFLCRFHCFVWFCLLPQRFKNSCTKCKQNFLTSSSCVRHVNKFSRCSISGSSNSSSKPSHTLPRTLPRSLSLSLSLSAFPFLCCLCIFSCCIWQRFSSI